MNEASARPRGGNGKAIVLGILAMFLGAALWAGITIVTEHRFGLLAIGIGALVGLIMFSARPTSTGIAAVAALLTVIGCALGEFLAIPAYVAHEQGIGFGRLVDLELKEPRVYVDSLDGVSFLFWTIGAVTAFGMVYRRIQAARVETAARNVAAAAQPYGTGQAYGAAPHAGAPAQAHPHAQPYGGAPQPAPFPPQPYGQGRAPYGQQPYGGQPGHGQQQSPPR